MQAAVSGRYRWLEHHGFHVDDHLRVCADHLCGWYDTGYFTDLALTVAYSLLASLLIALTVVPAMAKGLLKKETRLTALSQTGRFMDKYRTAVRWALSHRAIVLIAAVVLLVGSSGLALMRGLSFMPSMSTPQISATIQMPKESTLKETSDTTDKIVKEVRKVDGVETVGAMLSSNTMSMMGMSGTQDVTSTMVYIILNEDKADNGKIIAKKMDKLAKKYNCEIVTSADMDMSSMMGGSGVDIKLYSEDLTKLRSAGIAIESKLKGMKSLEDVSTIDEDSSEELHVVVNKNLAMKQGLTVAQVYQQISAKLTKESTATTLSESDTSMDVVVENSEREVYAGGSGEYEADDFGRGFFECSWGGVRWDWFVRWSWFGGFGGICIGLLGLVRLVGSDVKLHRRHPDDRISERDQPRQPEAEPVGDGFCQGWL